MLALGWPCVDWHWIGRRFLVRGGHRPVDRHRQLSPLPRHSFYCISPNGCLSGDWPIPWPGLRPWFTMKIPGICVAPPDRGTFSFNRWSLARGDATLTWPGQSNASNVKYCDTQRRCSRSRSPACGWSRNPWEPAAGIILGQRDAV